MLIDKIEEGDKVKGEIVAVLLKDQISHISENNLWPNAFGDANGVHRFTPQISDDLLPPSDYSDEESYDE